MAEALLALLSQQMPTLHTRKGLIFMGLQKDFLSPDGKLPVSTSPDFVDRIKELVPAFREFGEVIWVRSEYASNRPVDGVDETGDLVIVGSMKVEQRNLEIEGNVEAEDDVDTGDWAESPVPCKKARVSNDEDGSIAKAEVVAERTEPTTSGINAEDDDRDEELFLTRTATREPCCIPGTSGAEYASQIEHLIDAERDMQLVQTCYSAFGATSLLHTLRSRLITELYVGGCMTNLSVHATAMDAARYGIKITLIEDCLGYRTKARHEMAIARLKDIIEAEVMTSDEVIAVLRDPSPTPPDSDDDEWGIEDDISLAQLSNEVSRDNLLEAARDKEDDLRRPEFSVRDSHVSDRMHQLPSASPTASHLRAVAAPESEQATNEEPPDLPSSTMQIAVASQDGDYHPAIGSASAQEDARGETDHHAEPDRSEWMQQDGQGKEESLVEPDEAAPAGDRGVTVDESSDVVKNFMAQSMRNSRPHSQSKHPALAALSALVGLNQSTVDAYEQMMERARHSYSREDGRTFESTSSFPDAEVHESVDSPILSALPHGAVSQDEEVMEEARHSSSEQEELRKARHKPLFGEDKEHESAGSQIMYDLLSQEFAETIFSKLHAEIKWQHMHHQTGEVPRLVCCQGTFGADGSMPVYRHPSDQTLPIQSWTPAVDEVRLAAEKVAGHPLNHVLIQLYRSGNDYISEHSDKTLDIVQGSCIVNVSFGAQRTMRLRTKRLLPSSSESSESSPPALRTMYRVPMPHNSMIIMSLRTNAEYLHGINADKRPEVELIPAEKTYDGQRISLTFRHIGTWLNDDSSRIWGQGATGKAKEDARPVINGDSVESEKLVRAFGAENQASWIDWEGTYGGGFDVLHLK